MDKLGEMLDKILDGFLWVTGGLIAVWLFKAIGILPF